MKFARALNNSGIASNNTLGMFRMFLRNSSGLVNHFRVIKSNKGVKKAPNIFNAGPITAINSLNLLLINSKTAPKNFIAP